MPYRTYTYHTELTEHFACTKVPVGTTEQIHYTEVPVGTTGLILILIYQILFWYSESCTQISYVYYRIYTCISNLIHVIQNLYLSYRTYRTFCLYKSTRRYYITDSLYRGTRRYYRTYTYSYISDLILVFRILYSDLIRVLQNLYMYFKSYTCNTELILVLRNLYGSYETYTDISELRHVF